MTQDNAPDCSQHKREVAGMDMKTLAEAIGDLHYESLAELIGRLEVKFNDDAEKDFEADRYLLAKVLEDVSYSFKDVKAKIERAWQICKPFMEQNKTDQP